MTMLRKTMLQMRWSLIIPLLFAAPVTVPVTAQAAHDAADAYLSVLESVKEESKCPAGTNRQTPACSADH